MISDGLFFCYRFEFCLLNLSDLMLNIDVSPLSLYDEDICEDIIQKSRGFLLINPLRHPGELLPQLRFEFLLTCDIRLLYKKTF